MRTASFEVHAQGAAYSFILGFALEQEIQIEVQRFPKHRIAIIADSTVAERYGEEIVAMLAHIGRPAELLSFPAGEINKSLETAVVLQSQIDEKGFNRDSLLIALGGGVTGDLTGFVAGIHVRGIPFIQVPTTVLAMVDSSVGGKVGVDTPAGKNRVGLFYQPKAVIADMRFLYTLSLEHIRSGLIEAAKLFLCSDEAALKQCMQLDLNTPLQKLGLMQKIILRSVHGKAAIVERDPKEENERRILNLGHTIGHAIEHLSNYDLLHGICVGYGILAEAKVSELLGILAPQDYSRVVNILKHFGIRAEEFPKFLIDDIIAATRSDKKTVGGKAHCVLLNGIGSVHQPGGRYAHHVPDDVLKKALQFFA